MFRRAAQAPSDDSVYPRLLRSSLENEHPVCGLNRSCPCGMHWHQAARCSKVHLCSLDSAEAVSLHFLNESGVCATIIWLNYCGAEVAYGLIQPGERFTIRTFKTHPWIARSGSTANGAQLMLGDHMVAFPSVSGQRISITQPSLQRCPTLSTSTPAAGDELTRAALRAMTSERDAERARAARYRRERDAAKEAGVRGRQERAADSEVSERVQQDRQRVTQEATQGGGDSNAQVGMLQQQEVTQGRVSGDAAAAAACGESKLHAKDQRGRVSFKAGVAAGLLLLLAISCGALAGACCWLPSSAGPTPAPITHMVVKNMHDTAYDGILQSSINHHDNIDLGKPDAGQPADLNPMVGLFGDEVLESWMEAGAAFFPCIATLQGHADGVRSVAITPDGRRVVSGSGDGALHVWDMESHHSLAILRGHTGAVSSVAFSSDGRHAMSASDDGTHRVWDMQKYDCIATLQEQVDGMGAVAVTPSGRHTVLASDNALLVWDEKLRVFIASLQGHTDEVQAVAITPDGRYAVSGSSDATLRVWYLQL